MTSESTQIQLASSFDTWSQFKARVLTFIPLDANRLGISTLLQNYIRMAVIDLQDYVTRFRKGHESLYYAQDFVIEGHAQRGALPPFSKLNDCWVVDLERKRRDIVAGWDWEKRFELIHDRHHHHNRKYYMARDKYDHTFYVWPLLGPNSVLSINWDGLKLDYKEDELVAFDEDTAMAVADYCVAKIARYVERDAGRAQDFMQSFNLRRRNLFTRPRT